MYVCKQTVDNDESYVVTAVGQSLCLSVNCESCSRYRSDPDICCCLPTFASIVYLQYGFNLDVEQLCDSFNQLLSIRPNDPFQNLISVCKVQESFSEALYYRRKIFAVEMQ